MENRLKNLSTISINYNYYINRDGRKNSGRAGPKNFEFGPGHGPFSGRAKV